MRRDDDDVEARRWYQRAVDRGSAHGLRALGMMMIVGEGGPMNHPLGAAYLELAEEGGDQQAAVLRRQLPPLPSPDARKEVVRLKAEWIAAHGRPRSES